jgi:hypothetical protein
MPSGKVLRVGSKPSPWFEVEGSPPLVYNDDVDDHDFAVACAAYARDGSVTVDNPPPTPGGVTAP